MNRFVTQISRIPQRERFPDHPYGNEDLRGYVQRSYRGLWSQYVKTGHMFLFILIVQQLDIIAQKYYFRKIKNKCYWPYWIQFANNLRGSTCSSRKLFKLQRYLNAHGKVLKQCTFPVKKGENRNMFSRMFINIKIFTVERKCFKEKYI